MSDICRCICSNRGMLGFYAKNKITFGTCSVPFLYSSPLLLPFLHYLSHTIQYIPFYSFLPFYNTFYVYLISTFFRNILPYLNSLLFLLGFPFATLHYLRSCLHSFLSFLHYLLSRLWSLSLVSLSPLSLISMNYILTRHAFSHLHELHSHQTRALYCTYCMSTCINHHLTLSCPLCLPINLFLQPTFSLGLYYFVVLY